MKAHLLVVHTWRTTWWRFWLCTWSYYWNYMTSVNMFACFCLVYSSVGKPPMTTICELYVCFGNHLYLTTIYSSILILLLRWHYMNQTTNFTYKKCILASIVAKNMHQTQDNHLFSAVLVVKLHGTPGLSLCAYSKSDTQRMRTLRWYSTRIFI